MSPAEVLISRLDGVRCTGHGRWTAKAPTRQDRHPSLTIRELDDGRVLVHDHGGDSTEEVLAAIGMTMADLFPQRLGDRLPREHRPFPAHDVLRAIGFEVLVILAAASSVLADEPLAAADRGRMLLAVSRIQNGLELAGVH